MDFYKKNITCNLSSSQIREIIDFDIILGIKSKKIINNKELLHLLTFKMPILNVIFFSS